MEYLFYLTLISLIYKFIMPFVSWVVPKKAMENAAKYIEKTERRFPTKTLANYLHKFGKEKPSK